MHIPHFTTLVLTLLIFQVPTLAQNYCDPNLRTETQNPNAYRPRNDRCEGAYVEGKSGDTNLLIASFTETFDNFDPNTGKPLILEWNAPNQSRLRIRSYSLAQKRYYRMDTLRDPNQTSYSWNTSVLAALDFRKTQIGIVGWTEASIGNQKRSLYIPLRVSQNQKSARSKTLQLLIVPGVELREVKITLSLLGADGKPATVLKNNVRLSGDFYPEHQAFPVSMPTLQKSGTYFLSIGAVSRQGTPVSNELWFYYSAN